MGIRTIPIKTWPKGLGLDLARISIEIETLAQRLNVPLENGYDNLDYYKAFILDLNIGVVAFNRYRGMPDGSTIITCMEGSTDLPKLLYDILTALGIDARDIVWTCFWNHPLRQE